MAAAEHPSTSGHPRRHKQYDKYFSEHKYTGLNFPTSYKDIERFCKNNPDIIPKVYCYYGATKSTKKKQILHNLGNFYFPLLTAEEMKGKKVVYLLFLFPPEEVINARLAKGNYDVGHVIAITDINKFLRGYRTDNKEIICDCCGKTFRTQEALNKHINDGCYARETNQFRLSKYKVFFNAHPSMARSGFVQYADIESSMDKNMGHDDDWDEEHIPQAIEAHNITKYPYIFEIV